MRTYQLIHITLAFFLSCVSVNIFAKSDSINRDDLAKSNSECAAYYDVVKGFVKPEVKHEYMEKINTHYHFATQLHESSQSIESRYDGQLMEMKNKLKMSSIQELIQENFMKCLSIESHTPLIIKAHMLKINP